MNQRISPLLIRAAGTALISLLFSACEGGRSPTSVEPTPQPSPAASPPVTAAPPLLTAPAQGSWLRTDAHVHTDHSSDGSAFRQLSSDALPGNVSVADQIGQAVLNRLDFLALTDHRTYDQHWDPLWTSAALLLIPGEEANGRPHANVFGAVDTILNGPGDAERGFRATQQGLWDAHGQAAVFQTNHANRDWTDDNAEPNAQANTLGVDLIEVWNIGEDITIQLAYAEQRWNAGFLTGITASSDNHFRELWLLGFGPGAVQTEVFAAAPSERAILNALRQGRTTLTDGTPLAARVTLTADVDGDGVFEAVGGDAVAVTPSAEVSFEVRAERALGSEIRIFAAPGQQAGPIQTFAVNGLDQRFRFSINAPQTHHWVRAEIRGPGVPRAGIEASLADEADRRALSAPIFLLPGGEIPVPDTAIPVPVDGGQDDGAEVQFASDTQFSGFSDLARVEDETVYVAEQHTDTGTDVWFRRADSAPLRINTVTGFARFPRLAAQGATVWVVWEDERAGQRPRRPQIWARQSLDGGRTWLPEQRVDSGSARAIRPAIALSGDGQPVFAWSDNSRRCFDLFVRRGIAGEAENLSAEKSCTAGNPADTRSTRDPASLHPALAVSAEGAIVVVWQDNRFDINPGWTGQTGFVGGFEGLDRTDPDNWEIVSRRYDPQTQRWSDLVRISANSDGSDPDHPDGLADRHPTLAIDAAGRVLAAWDSKPLAAAGVNSAIVAAHSEDGGLSWSVAELVALEADAMSQRPAAAASAQGGIDLVWMDTRDADWRHRIWGVHWQAGRFDPVQRLSGRGNAAWPRVHQGQISFHSDRDTAVQRDLRWRVLSRPLAPVGHAEDARKHAQDQVERGRLTIPEWQQFWSAHMAQHGWDKAGHPH